MGDNQKRASNEIKRLTPLYLVLTGGVVVGLVIVAERYGFIAGSGFLAAQLITPEISKWVGHPMGRNLSIFYRTIGVSAILGIVLYWLLLKP